MDISDVINLIMIQSLMGALTGEAGAGGDVASGNTVLLPVAVAIGSVNASGPSLPAGVSQDRRVNLDRRAVPHPGRRRSDVGGPGVVSLLPVPGTPQNFIPMGF